MEFKEIVKRELKDKMPRNPRLSVLTERIILTQKEYSALQKEFIRGDYNMWCAGMNKKINPNSDPNLPFFNYDETGDARNFGKLFVIESVAEEEAEKAKEEAKEKEAKEATAREKN